MIQAFTRQLIRGTSLQTNGPRTLALIIVLRKKVAAGMRDRRRAKFTSCGGLFAWRVASGRHILVAITVNTGYLHFVLKVECRNDISRTGKWLVSDTGVSIIR